jgi:hypothetical protein
MNEAAFRLAAALLLHEGEISVSHIEALPLVKGRSEAWSIARELQKRFPTYATSRHRPGVTGLGTWEHVIALREKSFLSNDGEGSEPTAAAMASKSHPSNRSKYGRLVRRAQLLITSG